MGSADGSYGSEAERKSGRRRSMRIMASCVVAGALAGCAAGPDFRRPAAPEVSAYTSVPLPARTVSATGAFGGAQRFDVGGDVDTAWWRSFGSPRLDALIEQAFRGSPTLLSARATLQQAREIQSAQAGSTRYPQIDAGATGQRQRLSPSMLGQRGDAREFNLYDVGVGVHYRFDLAGGTRRSLEALAARTDFRRHELDGARLTLAANIATAAIARARTAGQIASMEAMLQAQAEQLAITRQRVRLGQAAPDDLLALRAQLEQTRAELPMLRKQLEQGEHLLAVLAGQAPGAMKIPDFTLDEFELPSELPVVLPSELARRRPDIEAAEALLHAATAEYGVATAKLYPQINLTASLGSQALSTGALFGGGSAVWSVLGQLTQPLFNPGLPAEKRAALAAVDAAAANYQGVVLDALRNVADVLRALDYDAKTLAAQASAEAAAQASLASVERQYALGTASYVQVLIARQQAQQMRMNQIAAQAQRLADSAALYQALGGGYADTYGKPGGVAPSLSISPENSARPDAKIHDPM
ncbi:efflux transporter outer membrane subunit [Thiobacillus sedimenti]|uniref:Efflux transporter outer membrane subunit n=1 Tax=Thiobacillus sedimenti TaxID=3110231 RepID=A0ABZ1CKB2_9PROT|nr:efflux transporter outer membrane subunit [Thiobacillus sp. SCUT-2]WRS39681.1 efflux transporter outer membrane subunit [Thiobacillus sp. SCUT-2]